MGTSLGYFLANDVQLVQGSYFSEEELENGAMVALLSEEALDDLFHGDADAAVGSTMTVSVNDKYYNLIIEGVYAKDEDETMSMYSMFMNSDATNLYIPLKTAQDINHASGYQTLTVVVVQIRIRINWRQILSPILTTSTVITAILSCRRPVWHLWYLSWKP